MQIDTKIGIQQIIALLTALLSIAAAFFTLKTDIRLQMEQNTRQDVTINELQKTVAEMRTDVLMLKWQAERRGWEHGR